MNAAPRRDNALREQGEVESHSSTTKAKHSGSLQKPQGKQDTILSVLKAGTSLNRFEAELIGDHCLHSTISGLRNKGHKIHDEWEWVPTRFGKVHVKRYVYIGCADHGEV